MYKLIFILFFSINAMATNIEYFGGDITYKHLFGSCLGFAHYEITVNLFTKKVKTAGDSIKVDGAPFYAKRTDSINIGNNILKSIYKTTRVLPGCGNYIFTYTDTINIQSVKNINLLSSKFSISTQLVLNPFYYGSVNRAFVYLKTNSMAEPELLIFDKGIRMDKFLDAIQEIK